MTMPDAPYPVQQRSAWHAVRPVVFGALLLVLARVVYLALFCPYTLVEDEAQYWVWSRHPALSYYTKGPGVAWAILASTKLFGHDEWAVRLPSALASSIALIALALLTHDCFRDSRITRRAAWCFVLVPAFLVSGFLMTIDSPLIACWALASWCAWRAISEHDRRFYPLLGLAIGVGVLFKYTMLLIVPGILIWACLRRSEGVARTRNLPWIVSGVILMLLAFLPVILWNQQHAWPTVKHLLGHLGIEGGDVAPTQGKNGWHYNPLWTLTLLGTQIGLIGPVLMLGIWGAIEAWKQRDEQHAAWRGAGFLIFVAAPVYIFYLLVSFIAEPEGNWPIAGAVTLIPLAGRRVVHGWDDYLIRVRRWKSLPIPRPWRGVFMGSPWTLTSALWCAAIVMSACIVIFGARLDLLARVPGIKRVVPLGRFTGADQMGAHAGELVNDLRIATGLEPFIIAMHYGRASQLSYYVPGRPDVYCASSIMPGGRVTPWDFWPELDLRRAEILIGRPALLVGLSQRHWQLVFDRVEYVGALRADHKVDKQGKPSRPAFLGYGFRGFPPPGELEAALLSRDDAGEGGQ